MNELNPQYYINNGFDVTVLEPASKKPMIKHWNTACLTVEDINTYGTFPKDFNLGVKLGTASDGKVDVDLDRSDAVSFGSMFLDANTQVFGREANPRSHYLYRVANPSSTIMFKHPVTKKMLVELRGNGSQTVLPGSLYKDGSLIRFEEGSLPEPAMSDWETLKRQCGLIAAACVVSEFWIEGSRHGLSVALGGWAAHKGISQAVFEGLIEAVAIHTHDDDVQDRINSVRDSYDKHVAGQKVAWIKDIKEHICDQRIMNKLAEWLGVNVKQQALSRDAPKRKPASFTSDLQSGQDFCDYIGDDLIFCDDESRFYYRKCDVYDPVSTEYVKKLVMDYVGSFDVDVTNYEEMRKLRTAQSISRINAIVDVTKSNVRRSSKYFDNDPYLVGCENGVLDLRTSKLVDPEGVVTKRLGTVYNGHSWCPHFHKFLEEVFDADQEKIEFIRRAIGYTLTGSTNGQCMFVAIGTGANGKSTFLKLIQALMGDYGGSIPSHSLMTSKFGNDKTDDIASLAGKRFVSASEGEIGQRIAIAKVKLMTGGDPISCRPLYGKYFTMKPDFKIWFGTNDLPVIQGGDEAIWRRIHVIDFPVSFSESQRDGGLYDKLKLELPGILNWALQGVREIGDMKGDFLNPPACVRNETGRYRSDSDTVASFIEVRCERVEGGIVMMNLLFEAYERWCTTSSLEPLSSNLFGKELTRLGFPVKKRAQGNGRLGIGLKK